MGLQAHLVGACCKARCITRGSQRASKPPSRQPRQAHTSNVALSKETVTQICCTMPPPVGMASVGSTWAPHSGAASSSSPASPCLAEPLLGTTLLLAAPAWPSHPDLSFPSTPHSATPGASDGSGSGASPSCEALACLWDSPWSCGAEGSEPFDARRHEGSELLGSSSRGLRTVT